MNDTTLIQLTRTIKELHDLAQRVATLEQQIAKLQAATGWYEEPKERPAELRHQTFYTTEEARA